MSTAALKETPRFLWISMSGTGTVKSSCNSYNFSTSDLEEMESSVTRTQNYHIHPQRNPENMHQTTFLPVQGYPYCPALVLFWLCSGKPSGWILTFCCWEIACVSLEIHHSPHLRFLLLLTIFTRSPLPSFLFVRQDQQEAWSHHCDTGNGSQSICSTLFFISSPCPTTITQGWVLTSLGALAHTEKVTDSVPREASLPLGSWELY